MNLLKNRHNRKCGGFTLVEMVIVLLVLTILLAIAIPQIIRARENARTKSCMANLWELQGAELRWAMENNKTKDSIPEEEELVPNYVKRWPECPNGGTYTLRGGDEVPLCSIGPPHEVQ